MKVLISITWILFKLFFCRIDKLQYAELKAELKDRDILGHRFVDLFDSKGIRGQYVPLYPTAGEG
jgi:hypothetical protein